MRKVVMVFLILSMHYTTMFAAFWEDDFTTWNSTQYFYHGDTYWRTDGRLILTTNNPTRYGRLYYKTLFYMGNWRAEFDLYTGGGVPGADGFVFGWVTDYSYPYEDGGSMNFHNANGYGVEFDTYFDSGFDPITANHVAVDQNSFSNHLYYTACNIEDATWHHIAIEFHMGNVQVFMDGTPYVNYTIPGYVPYLGYFGISAATGSAGWNWHSFDNIIVTDMNTPTVTPSATLTPTLSPPPTFTASTTATLTPTEIPTSTPTPTVSITPTEAFTTTQPPTVSPVITATPTAVSTPAAIPSLSEIGVILSILILSITILRRKEA